MTEDREFNPDSLKSQIDYSSLLDQLKESTPFDLYRLRSAVDRMLDDPARIARQKQLVRVGDEIDYFDPEGNRSVKAHVLRCNRTRAVVKNVDDGVTWQITYCSINTDGVSTTIRERPASGLGRNEVRVGDRVGFLDRKNHEHFGTIARLNPKTVTVKCDGEDGQWRVSYSFLFRVVDADSREARSNVIEALSFHPTAATQ